MAQSKSSSNTEPLEESIADFKFDDPQEFDFEPGGLGRQKPVTDDGDDADDAPTNLDEDKTKEKEKPKPVVKKKAAATAEETDNDDEPVEEEFFGDKKKDERKATDKSKAKAREDTEAGEEGEEKEEDDKEKDKKGAGAVEDDDEKTDDEIFTAMAADLKEKGIFSTIKLAKGEVVTEDKFYEHFEAEFENRLDEAIEDMFEGMDDEGKAFIKFKRDGGDTKVFLSQYGSTLGIEEFDDENPTHVSKVIRHYISKYENPEDDEALEDRIRYIKDSGKEKATAARYYKTIKKDDDERRKAVVEMQEEAAQKRLEGAKNFNLAIKDTLSGTEKIKEYTITKADQKELEPYLTKATVKVGKNRYATEFSVELNRILRGAKKEDREELILLAKQIKAKFKLPDDLVTKVKTAVTSEAKSKLATAKRNPRVFSSGGAGKKSLAEYID